VASVGGFVPQYQVTADPARLRALGIPFAAVVEAVRAEVTSKPEAGCWSSAAPSI